MNEYDLMMEEFERLKTEMKLTPKFARAMELILDDERGYVDSKYDRGGKTRYGITEYTARLNGYDGDMRELPLEFAIEVYEENYWYFGDIKDWDIAIEAFDQAVNMGVGKAVKNLQRSYNLLTGKGIAVDGIIGNQTVTAINSYKYPYEIYKTQNLLQGKLYIELSEQDPIQRNNFRGWLKRVDLERRA